MKKILFVLLNLLYISANAQKPNDKYDSKILGSNVKFITVAATIQTGTYIIKSAIEGKNMDVINGNNANGVGLHLWDAHGGDAQQFTIEPTNEAGYYYIKTKWGRAVDVAGYNSNSGASLNTYDVHGGDNQKWKFIAVGDGYYNIQSKYGTYIDVRGGGSASGTQIWMSAYSTWGNNIAQRWKLEKRTGTAISASTWKNTLNRVFSASSVRLNNYTPIQNQYDRNERQFYKPNDSYLQLNIMNDGSPRRFNIPIDVMQIGPNSMFKMYINDWNTNRIVASSENGRIKISLLFEDEGVEIVGNCYNNGACAFTTVPNFNYSNSRIDIYLDLIASGGQVSYNAAAVFTANVNESGPCVNNLFAFLCPSDRAGLIKGTVEAKLNEYMNAPLLKALLIQKLALTPNGTTVNGVSINNQGDIQIW